MKILLILLPLAMGLIAAIATVVIGGALMPRAHRATASMKLPIPIDRVWSEISDPARYSTWRKDIKGVERLADRNGRPVLKEIGGAMGDDLIIEVTRLEPPNLRTTTIADDSLPFGGSWTWELNEEDGGTRLRITEDGVIRPAGFRYLARIFGLDATLRQYLKGLAAHLGVPPAIEP